MVKIISAVYPGPIGEIQILVKEASLVFLDFADNTDRIEKLMGKRYGAFEIVESENPERTFRNQYGKALELFPQGNP